MRKLVVFQQISLDGYFMDSHGDMSWAKNDNDEEFNAFSSENAKGGGVLLRQGHLRSHGEFLAYATSISNAACRGGTDE
jgi:hypothetical protein